MSEDLVGNWKSGKKFDLFAVVIISGLSLTVAYVCFGILSSQAEIDKYSMSGAIAGFIVTMGLLTSVYLQIRKSSDDIGKLTQVIERQAEELSRTNELADLRKNNRELEQKLLRNAPSPPGFQVEISEREHIVLARPKEWEVRGGMLFDFDLPEQALQNDDLVPARFFLQYYSISDHEAKNPDEFYRNFRESVHDAPQVMSHTSEFIYIGGEPNALKSLKIIAREHVKARKVVDSITKSEIRQWNVITVEEWQDEMDRLGAEEAAKAEAAEDAPKKRKTGQKAPDPENGGDAPAAHQQVARPSENIEPGVEYFVEVRRMLVVCCHPELKRSYLFDFMDDNVDFPESSAKFNQVLESVRFL